MARTSSLPSPRGAWLGPLVGLLNAAAACMLMGVLALGVLYARLFGAAVTKEREPESEPNQSAAHSNSARLKDTDANAPVFIDDGARTPVQRRYSSSQGWQSEDDFAEPVCPTPPDQMLCSGVGPTPATPAPAHPAAQTELARRTSAPPSPTATVPRNLESVLLAAANADGATGCTASCTAAADTDPDKEAASVTVPDPPISTSPPPLPSDPACCRAVGRERGSAAPSSPPEVGKADPACRPDAVKTVPRRLPSATAPAPAAHGLRTAPFETAATAAGGGEMDMDMDSPTLATSSGIAKESSNCRRAFDDASGSALSADSPTTPWPARHQINILFQEEQDSADSPDSPDGAAGCAAAAEGAKAAAGPLWGNGGGASSLSLGLQQHPADQLLLHEGEEGGEKEKPDASGARRTGVVAVPVVELPTTPRPLGPEETRPGEAEAAGAGHSSPRFPLLKVVATASGDGATGGGGTAEVLSPLSVAETPIAFGHPQQRQLLDYSQAGTPVSSPVSQKLISAAEIGLSAADGTPPLKSRAASGPRGQAQQQQQPRASEVPASSSQGGAAVVVIGGLQQKRAVVSPPAAGAAATPATSRRPVGSEAVTRGPRPGMEKNPVARKLNPPSPNPDAAPAAPTGVTAAWGQESGSPGGVRREAPSTAARGGNAYLPRYAAPTAASIARKTQLSATLLRNSSSQKGLLASGVSFVGAETGGGGGGVDGEEVGGGVPGAAGRRGARQGGKLRAAISGSVLAT